VTALVPNYAASRDWLRWLYPAGPWVLTAIEPDRRGIETATFRPETEAEMFTWLANHGRDRNLYYHLNRPMRDLTKKAERADLAAVHFLHVDIDPRAGEDLAKEQARIQALLANPPGGVPLPSAVIYSGGGCNAIWRLEEPIEINGSLEAAEYAARFNLQLEIIFVGDNCHNVDRILRLPGTINWPDARKRRKGRVPALARVLGALAASYALNLFTAAAAVQRTDVPSLGQAPRVQVPGNLRRYAPEELPEGVSGKLKVLLIEGRDPDEPNKYPSRSEALFAACCGLVRADCSDEVIYSVITDPDYRISESVRGARAGMERYALRQIERAREEAIDPWLRKLNEKHAVILNMGGKCRVIEEIERPAMERTILTKQSFEDFRNRYCNQDVQIGTTKKGEPIEQKLGIWWLTHPQRRQYETIVFNPEREAVNAYNLWRGFSCEARPGTKHELLLRHVRENVCQNVDEYYDYLLGWMARAVQNPATPGEVAVVMRGAPGTGKGMLAREYGKLWGRHFLQISDTKHLVGSFNAHLRDCVVLFADEAFYAGDKKHESLLKALVTEEMFMIESKGVDAEASANYVHIIMASNSNWVVPAELKERRYFVLDVSDDHMQDSTYFGAIREAMDNGGRENLLHFLKTYDLSKYDVRAVPKTEALRDQKQLSLESYEDWWFNKLRIGVLLPEHLEWSAPARWDSLCEDYTNQVRGWKRASLTMLWDFVNHVVPGTQWDRRPTVLHANGSVAHGVAAYLVLPSLEECRAHWDAKFGGPYRWPNLELQGRRQEEPF
jgi:hypothetical protein